MAVGLLLQTFRFIHAPRATLAVATITIFPMTCPRSPPSFGFDDPSTFVCRFGTRGGPASGIARIAVYTLLGVVSENGGAVPCMYSTSGLVHVTGIARQVASRTL